MNTHLIHPQHPANGDPERRLWLLTPVAAGSATAEVSARSTQAHHAERLS